MTISSRDLALDYKFGPVFLSSQMKPSVYCPVNQLFFCSCFQVFWAGPLCGGIVAALLYDFVLFPRGPDPIGRFKVLCHGVEAAAAELEPLLGAEGDAPVTEDAKP